MAQESIPESAWHAYLLKCADGTLYAGSTNNLERRISEHNTSEKGAKYTRTRRPVLLYYSCACKNRSDAAKKESYFKSLSRKEKMALVTFGE